jgi:PTS system mannitol-specific IIA component
MSNVLELSQINLHGSASTSSEAIDEAGRILVATGAVTSEYLRYMHDREVLVSTFMGNFLAIPHGTNEGKDTILASALSFVRFVVGIAGKDGGHMDVLSRIALIFSDEEQVDRLLVAVTAEEVLDILGDVNG